MIRDLLYIVKPSVVQGFDWYTIYWRSSPCKQGKDSDFASRVFSGKETDASAGAYRWSHVVRMRKNTIHINTMKTVCFQDRNEWTPFRRLSANEKSLRRGREKGYPCGCSPLSRRVSLLPVRRILRCFCRAEGISRRSRAALRRCRTGNAGGIRARARRFSSLQWPARIPGWDSWWRRASGT